MRAQADGVGAESDLRLRKLSCRFFSARCVALSVCGRLRPVCTTKHDCQEVVRSAAPSGWCSELSTSVIKGQFTPLTLNISVSLSKPRAKKYSYHKIKSKKTKADK